MIKVAKTAREKVAILMKEEGFDPSKDYVRVGVKSVGVLDSYELKFDQHLEQDDQLFEDNEVRILVDKKSLLYLVGTTLEYAGGLNGKGFVFNNQMRKNLRLWRSFRFKKKMAYTEEELKELETKEYEYGFIPISTRIPF